MNVVMMIMVMMGDGACCDNYDLIIIVRHFKTNTTVKGHLCNSLAYTTM